MEERKNEKERKKREKKERKGRRKENGRGKLMRRNGVIKLLIVLQSPSLSPSFGTNPITLHGNLCSLAGSEKVSREGEREYQERERESIKRTSERGKDA